MLLGYNHSASTSGRSFCEAVVADVHQYFVLLKDLATKKCSKVHTPFSDWLALQIHLDFNGTSKFDEGTDTMSEWLTDEFTAGALMAIANATRYNDRAKEIAISIKTQMEDHFEGPWQVIVGTDFASAITVMEEKFFYAKKNDFTIHIFKAK
ncbi:hypothetical protein TcWFU_008724 [Taenia crassiceps]|uniref:Uncharacterized protein n=1 Tax=Taenia crassiceps TaxID=6207 RepID=A0ABR4QM09_9CEST